MDTSEKKQRREAVRRALTAGTLPSDGPVKIWAGHGSGKTCVVCGRMLTPQDVEYGLEFATRPAVTLDQHCHALWEEERAKR
jgi:hypothetical protein